MHRSHTKRFSSQLPAFHRPTHKKVGIPHAAARKAAQLATIERSNPFDSELGAHAWIRSAEDILTYREAIDSFGGVDDVTPAAQHT